MRRVEDFLSAQALPAWAQPSLTGGVAAISSWMSSAYLDVPVFSKMRCEHRDPPPPNQGIPWSRYTQM
jgi:hypothetical protein